MTSWMLLLNGIDTIESLATFIKSVGQDLYDSQVITRAKARKLVINNVEHRV